MKKHLLALASLSVMIWATPASAQFAKAEDAVKYRKATFVVMAAHTGRMGAMAQGKVPFDAKVAVENAEILAQMSKLPWAAFGEGTETVDSKAKDEVWKESAKFKEKADKFQADAQKLVAAAKTGKEDAFKTAFGVAAGNCKSCHDDFRNK
jgi:cytochrome c556